MEVKQIYTLMNSITEEILGEQNLVTEDLSNIVDIGTQIFNATEVDNYVKSLVNHIGKVIFVNRPYTGNVPSIFMDSWEYGSVIEKISAELPEAIENESWSLQDKHSYPTDVFYQPKVSAKFFNNKITFEVPMSFTELQVKESFSSASELNGFLSMLYSAVDKSMTIKIDSLIMRTINNMIAHTLYAEYSDSETGEMGSMTGTSMKAVNLLKLYNDNIATHLSVGNELTADEAINNPDFIKFASYTMGLYKDRLSKISTLFNVGGQARFTPAANLHIVMLSEFVQAARVYLESDTFHNEAVALPQAETVPYWQASGQLYNFTSTSAINVQVPNSVNANTKETVSTSGILGVMFDSDACGVCNTDRRVTTAYNAKAEFFTNFYKFDASYFNDLNENFVVFYVK